MFVTPKGILRKQPLLIDGCCYHLDEQTGIESVVAVLPSSVKLIASTFLSIA
jgi:hypothetical protein